MTTRRPSRAVGVSDPDLPEEAYAVALASVPGVGPATLRRWLAAEPPSQAWARHGHHEEAETAPDVRARRPAAVRDLWERHRLAGISVVLRGGPCYPSRLAGDPDAPWLLLCLGNPAVLSDAPTVALVGTRAPTRYGIGVAAQLGAELSAAGVSVVSGLALGIDGAAHEGACDAGAPPIAVVAGGLDRPYPRRHERLWDRVARRGVVVSESPSGVRTEKWRFPVRNRLLAALSDVVVVVESRHHGGARHTVDAALARGVPVGAVPGSIRSAASEGTNALVGEGAFPVTSAGDVLVALSLAGVGVPNAHVRPAGPRSHEAPSAADAAGEAAVAGLQRVVYEVLTQDPASLDELARVTGIAIPALCGALEGLAQSGHARDVGGWWERA